jgi:predicted CXXCH cytochrome family protein
MMRLFRLLPVLTAALVFIGAAARAQEVSHVPRPDLPPAAEGEKCLRDNEFMRRNHMKMLLHKRDLTVHDGDRGAEFSLKKCLTCHAVRGADGQAVSSADPRHFCRSCHDYAAVRIDCFECHSSVPEPAAKSAASPLGTHQIADLYNYLKEAEQ